MRVLFWNINRQERASTIAAIAAERSSDLIILAEGEKTRSVDLLDALAMKTGHPFTFHFWEGQDRLQFYSRFSLDCITPLADATGIAARLVKIPACPAIIVVAVHSASQREWKLPADRFALAQRIAQQLDKVEGNCAHFRSIVVGDFNSDPFDDALMNSEALHAVMCRKVAERQTRVVNGEPRRFLYNPMFSLLGDMSPGPPGTYYYRTANSSCRFWHSFDQVLIRPDLVTAFDNSELAVVTSTGELSLAKPNGQPDPSTGSDHFPIAFRLNLLGANDDA